ncbi:MAG: tetratricopeptide repeat protein [candidate division NC10 bacterium]|nr:tetratricopeptide repeat protein [candidate division NC10 bacterium]
MIKVLKVEDDFSVCRRLYATEYAPEFEVRMLGLVREDFPIDSVSWLELYEASKVSGSIPTPAAGLVKADPNGGRSGQTELLPGLLDASVSKREKSSSEYLLSKDGFDLKFESIHLELRHFNISLFQIDGFERIQVKKGLPFAETLSKKLEASLSECLSHDAIVGKREAPEKFGVIIPGKLAADVKKIAADALSKFNQDTGATLSCGIFCTDDEGKLKEEQLTTQGPIDRSTYERKKSLSYAEKALEIAQFEGGNNALSFGTSVAMTKALFHYSNKEFEKAVEEFERIDKLGVSCRVFHNRFGVGLSNLGQHERALRQHELALLYSNDVISNRNVAGSLCRLHRYCEAVEYFKKAETMLMEKKWDEAEISEAEEFQHFQWFEYGLSYYECENEGEARRTVEEENYRKAIEKFTQAIELRETGAYYLYRGRTYLRLGNRESAANDLRMAVLKGISESKLNDVEREVSKEVS